jgi:hypothetical protein
MEDSVITWTLESVDGNIGKTRVTLVHSGLKGNWIERHDYAWKGYISQLMEYCKTGKMLRKSERICNMKTLARS